MAPDARVAAAAALVRLARRFERHRHNRARWMRRRVVIIVALLAFVGAVDMDGGPRATSAKPRSFLNPFPSGSIWNTPLPKRPSVDPQSSQKVAYWLTHIRNPNLRLRAYATAIAVATPQSPKYRINCAIYACPTMHRFGLVPIPAGTSADPSPDGHLAIWDPIRSREWDLWASRCPTSCATAGSGGSFSTNAKVPQVRQGGNAAGVPLLAGIVHPEEIGTGRIQHPLVFSSPNVGRGRVCPARHDDGDNPDPRALKEGTLLQLDPRVRVAALPIPVWQKTIARALQRYGMYLVDGGGSLSIGAENTINRGDVWGQLGLLGDSVKFSTSFPWGAMRVLRPRARWCKGGFAGHNHMG